MMDFVLLSFGFGFFMVIGGFLWFSIFEIIKKAKEKEDKNGL